MPASAEDSIGWYLSLYWPAMNKEFKGVVQKYDHDSKHHTVKWDNAPKGSDGVTEVDLTEGELTWLKAPEKPVKKAAKGKPAAAKSKPKSFKEYDALETMEDLEARFTGKTTKAVAFQVLKKSGVNGLTLQEIVDESQKLGLRDWTQCKQPKTTINVCVSQDSAFVKISPGRVGLRINGAQTRDASQEPKHAKASGASKKRGRPPKTGEARPKKVQRQEPQHWERKPPIEVSIEVYTSNNTHVTNAPISVPYNVTIKALKKAISNNTKGMLKPHYQQLYHDNRNIGVDEDAFLVHAVRPHKFERTLDLKLVISDQ